MPRSLRKASLGGNTGKRQGEDLPTFQRDRHRICKDKFSKVNGLRKGKWWRGILAVRKKRVKFSQAQRTVKAVLVTAIVVNSVPSICGFMTLGLCTCPVPPAQHRERMCSQQAAPPSESKRGVRRADLGSLPQLPLPAGASHLGVPIGPGSECPHGSVCALRLSAVSISSSF